MDQVTLARGCGPCRKQQLLRQLEKSPLRGATFLALSSWHESKNGKLGLDLCGHHLLVGRTGGF